RKKLSFWERLYLPAIAGGFKVTSKHFVNTLFKRNTAAKETAGGFYPETKWVVGEGYRGAPYLVRDQDGDTKCVSCQLGEIVDRPNAEKMPKEFEINMLRCIFCGFCQEVCPEEAIFLQKDYSLHGLT